MALFKFSRDREVRASQQRLANALAKVDEAILIVDTDAKLTYLNEKAENLFGILGPSAIGTDVFQRLSIAEENGTLLRKDDLMHRMRKDESWEQSRCHVVNKKDNMGITASVSLSPIHDEKNQFLGCAIVIVDNPNKQELRNEDAVASSPASVTLLDSQVIQNSFFVKKGSMLVKVFLDNIQWIQAMDNYVIIQTNSDQFVIHSTMKDIEAKLPTSKFLRVHRSYIIPIEKINVLDENTVLIGDKTIPIGKSYKDTFMARLNFL